MRWLHSGHESERQSLKQMNTITTAVEITQKIKALEGDIRAFQIRESLGDYNDRIKAKYLISASKDEIKRLNERLRTPNTTAPKR